MNVKVHDLTPGEVVTLACPEASDDRPIARFEGVFGSVPEAVQSLLEDDFEVVGSDSAWHQTPGLWARFGMEREPTPFAGGWQVIDIALFHVGPDGTMREESGKPVLIEIEVTVQ